MWLLRDVVESVLSSDGTGLLVEVMVVNTVVMSQVRRSAYPVTTESAPVVGQGCGQAAYPMNR